MAFTDDEKLALLKEKCKEAVEKGTTWPEFKAEFLTFPAAFQAEVLDFMQAELDKLQQYKSDVNTKRVNTQNVRDELI